MPADEEAPGWVPAEDEDPLATSEWNPSMGCRHWARGDHRWQAAGRRLSVCCCCWAPVLLLPPGPPFPPSSRLLRRLPLEDLGPPAPPEPVLDVGEAALEEPAAAVEAARAVAGDSLFSNVSSSRMRSSRASRKVGKGRLRRRAGCDVGGPRRG